MTFYKSKALESQEKVTNEELAALKENGTRDVVDLPKGKNAVINKRCSKNDKEPWLCL